MRTLIPLLLATACSPSSSTDTAPRCPAPQGAPTADLALSTYPFAQVTPEGVRLRVEVFDDDHPLPILLGTDGCAEPMEVQRSTVERDFKWPPTDVEVPFPDRPGPHTLHEAVFTDLQPGQRYQWEIHAGPDQLLTGSFRAPPAPGDAFTAVFVGDTMAPNDEEVHARMGEHPADLYLHGGDLQYQVIATDTWASSMRSAAPVLQQALFHIAPGNHEYEGFDEFDQIFRRWFEGAGHAGADGYHAIDYGGVRFLLLDSEDGLGDPGSAQVAWLTAQLEDAAHLRTVVPVFHRPARTLSRHAPRLDIRQTLEPLFEAHDVRLVLTSHNHVYERFQVKGITWIVEGGGGALPYPVSASAEDFPEEVELRQAAVQTFGFLRLDFDAEGIDLTRYNRDGEVSDQWRVPLPASR